MNAITKYSLFFLTLFSSCSKSDVTEVSSSEMVEVSIGGSSTFTTRTSLGGDDLDESQWEPGDEIAVWAKSADDSFTLLGEKFEMRYYNSTYSSSDFYATIPSMAEGEYTYYGVYPYPTSYGNTSATFSLSSTQSGEYDGVNDIMVAKPIVANELTSSTLGAESLSFSHLMHIFRFEIPDGRNDFGMNLTGLEVTFSQSVVGDVSVDITNPTSATTLSSGSNTVYISFDEPFECGDDRYMWMFINPTTLSGDVSFVVYGEDGNISQTKITTAISGDFAAGAITPIRLTLPEPKTLTTIQVKIPHADVKTRIGETLQSVTFTAPSGLLINGESNELEFEAELDGDDIYELYFYDLTDEEIATLSSGSLGIQIDTERVEKTLTSVSTSGIAVGDTKLIDDIEVPYFLKTDFSNITDTGSASTIGESHTSSIDGIEELAGWKASTRATWTEGSHVTVRPYYFTLGSYQTLYTSKVSSCELGDWGLKSTASNVSVYVSYTATWTKSYHGSVTISVGGTAGGSINNGMYSDVAATDFTEAGTKIIENAEISGLSSSSRIGWLGSGTFGSSNTSTTTYDIIDIDDVTITLVEEE